MIWLTWRQHRAEFALGALILVTFASGLAVIGLGARHLTSSIGLPACFSNCGALLDQVRAQYHWLPPVVAVLVSLPLLAGMFVGAPLVSREFEAGTQRLVWTQSVTRLRWISVKLAIIVSVFVVSAAALGLAALWALDPLAPAFGTRFNSVWFEILGVLPAACMLVALAVGVIASALWRRTIPAMAATLVAYAAVRFPIHFFRLHLVAPLTNSVTLPLNSFLTKPNVDPLTILGTGLSPNDRVFQTVALDPSGHPIPNGFRALFQSYCSNVPSRGPIPSGILEACRVQMAGLNVRIVSQYQPAARFWTLQGVEGGFLFLLAAALIATTIFIVSRRRSV
jgi:hypothetical protein